MDDDPKDVRELGALIKYEYPEYEDEDEVALGRWMKNKYPEDFAHISDIADGIELRALENTQKYDPNQGEISSWWQGRKIDARNTLLTKRSSELRSARSLASQVDLVRKEQYERSRWPEQQRRTEELEQLIHENKVGEEYLRRLLIEAAARHEMDVTTYLEYRKKIAFDQADLDKQRNEDLQAIRLGESSKNLSEQTRILEIQSKLDELYEEVYDLASGSDPTKKRKIAARERTIKALENDKGGREKRLLQGDNGKNKKGGAKKAKQTGDIKSPLETDSE